MCSLLFTGRQSGVFDKYMFTLHKPNGGLSFDFLHESFGSGASNEHLAISLETVGNEFQNPWKFKYVHWTFSSPV